MDFIDLKTQYKQYQNEIDPLLFDVMSSARFIMGPEIKELEIRMNEYVGVPHSIACSSGTDALYLALMALGVGSGDEIITTPFTFIATVEVISLTGATPVFVDIKESDYNLDIDQIESKITPKTKGIIPVSLFGQIPDMDRINAIAEKHNLFVLEDAAQSFGALYKNRKSGNLTKIAATSFFPAKPLGCFGDGGMVYTSDDELAKIIRSLLNHGQSVRYMHERVGINGRLDNLQAAVLNVKLSHFEDEVDARQIVAARYKKILGDLPLKLPEMHAYTTRSVYAQYSIRIQNRDTVVQSMQNQKIPVAVHYPIPIHLQKAYNHLNYKKGDFPVAEKIASEIMSLPMHPFLKEEDQVIIGKGLKEAISETKSTNKML